MVNNRRLPRWARNTGKIWREHRQDQAYCDDEGYAWHEIADEWVRAPELDAHASHAASLDKPWRRPDGAIIVAQ